MTAAREPVARVRRTQSERREATIAKLLDAAADTIVDLGYAAATVQAICSRAGVSQGALFRHFPTREALIVALCGDLGRRVLDTYRAAFEAASDTNDPMTLAMRLLRTQCRSRINQAWYELAIAARTSPELRRALRPVAARYYEDIEALARELLPDLARALGPRFRVLVDTIVCVFDGEAIHRMVHDDEELDRQRVEVLAAALAPLLVAARPTR